MIVLTDGRDENAAGTGPGSDTTFDELLKTLRASEAAVFTIALGSNVDRARLEQVATESGGDAYFPETVEALPAEYARIVETLRRRYVISYNSSNLTRDGKWRAVELRSRDPHTRVSMRGGYFAPDK